VIEDASRAIDLNGSLAAACINSVRQAQVPDCSPPPCPSASCSSSFGKVMAKFYTPGAKGYTDYPALME
jgi:hypothetical protein